MQSSNTSPYELKTLFCFLGERFNSKSMNTFIYFLILILQTYNL